MNEEIKNSARIFKEKGETGPLIRRGAQSQVALKAAIIGGGKACEDLLTLLSNERLNRLNMEILGVAEPNPDTPGISLARDMGIFTTNDFTELYSLPGLNLIIELTGSTVVREQMIHSKPLEMSSIDHRGARLLWDLIQIESEKQQLQSEAEKAIIRERDWCQRVIDSLPDRIMTINKDYTIYSVNKTFVKETGLTEKEVIGQFCYEISDRISKVCSRGGQDCPFEKVFSSGETASIIHPHQDAAGDTVYEEITANPILDDKGAVTQIIEGTRNVTRLIILERELRESEQKLRRFLESAHDIICIKDLEGQYLYVNPAATGIMQTENKNVIGHNDFEIFPEPVARAMANHDQEMLLKQATLFSKEKLTINGQGHYFHTVRFPIYNDQGEIVSIAIIARDMTEEITLQEEVRQNKEYLQNILDNSSDVIITTGLQGEVVTFNPAAEHMLGFKKEESFNMNIENLWKTPAERQGLMAEVEAKGAVNNYPTTLVAKDGHGVEVSLSLSELRDSEGRLMGTVGISKDVTEENRLRAKLIEQERLAAAGQTVAGVTHCMKNVLNGLKGGAYMVNIGLKRDKTELLEEGWGNVQKGIDRIGKLSLDMLSFCRDRKPNPVPTDPLRLARETADIVLNSARQEGVRILCYGDDTSPVNIDPETIGHALLDLITNAVDACTEKSYDKQERPQVHIGVKRENDKLFFSVKDNGIGMDTTICNELFTRFFSTKDAKGTGLGLCLTHKIVEEHRGSIEVESSPGKGSTFTISLPTNLPQGLNGNASKQ